MKSVPLAEARCSFVAANGLRFRYWQLGAAGPPIVLLHGYTSTAWRTWWRVAPLLATRYRTYWLDLRGHGESDKPMTGYSLSDYAADARAICAALALERPILAGHSLGGATILTLASETPDLPAAIVPVDPPLWWEGGQPAARTRFFDVLDYKHLAPADYLAAIRRDNPGIADEELAEQLVGRAQISLSALVETWRALSGVDMLAPLAGQVTAPMDLLTPLACITCPVLLVRGAQTEGVPIPSVVSAEQAEQALARLARGREVVVPGVGHQIPHEQPEALAAAMLDFLAASAMPARP